MGRAARRNLLETPPLFLAQGSPQLDMHSDARDESLIVLFRLELNLDRSETPSLPLRIHAQRDAHSGP